MVWTRISDNTVLVGFVYIYTSMYTLGKKVKRKPTAPPGPGPGQARTGARVPGPMCGLFLICSLTRNPLQQPLTNKSAYGPPWDPMGPYGTLWDPQRPYGIMWKPIGPNVNLWNLMDPMGPYEIR